MTFGEIKLNEIFTWVDALYAIHHGMRIQTGCAMTMGFGVNYLRSRNNKLNTKIYTEEELVGTSDYVPYKLRYIIFSGIMGYNPGLCGLAHAVVKRVV